MLEWFRVYKILFKGDTSKWATIMPNIERIANGEKTSFDETERMFFELAKIEETIEKAKQLLKTKIENGKKGGRPKKTKKTNQNQMVTDIEEEIEQDIEIEQEKRISKRNKCVSDNTHTHKFSEDAIMSLLNDYNMPQDWPLMEAYKGYFDLVRKVGLSNYAKLDILTPLQYETLVMRSDYTPQQIWDATKELNNNVKYCDTHQSAYQSLVQFCKNMK